MPNKRIESARRPKPSVPQSSASKPVYFGECAICRQGTLAAVKDNESGKLILICDECESQWDSPEASLSYDRARTVEVRALRDATEDEVREAGWTPHVR